ncbi:hypothetical protein SAMN04487848_1013 [Microbacterium sp. ru370.1]|uniref:DUF7882 family protein n=1 Tax=unclassified Microbacterium TaxID=2609290 RepID=UPI00088E7D99|nr:MULTISPECIES: hypothetical protein [unclassified Microbacterium]SDO46380.1 hypothetical protein SAMN04487848_1013 [Microbacterium sp. ru370.1]SIT81718.1 hypothetical protein SAMN05880579_1009 [Microbacterium sp. RU1D]
MGSLFYGSSERAIEIPDRILAHVKVVIATKLRRGESFTMSWRHPSGESAGRSTIWIQPSIPLRFVFGSVEPEMLDPALLQTYANSSNSSSGLTVDLETHDVIAAPVDAS